MEPRKATGVFTLYEAAAKHPKAAAMKVLISAPSKDVIICLLWTSTRRSTRYQSETPLSMSQSLINGRPWLCGSATYYRGRRRI